MGGGLITNYQTARYFGATVDESVSVFYGAIGRVHPATFVARSLGDVRVSAAEISRSK
jgi:hypothetical protein